MCRADGLLTELLTAGLELPIDSDPVLALALSVILLMLSQDKVTPPLFSTAPAARLAARLLQVGSLPRASGMCSMPSLLRGASPSCQLKPYPSGQRLIAIDGLLHPASC